MEEGRAAGGGGVGNLGESWVVGRGGGVAEKRADVEGLEEALCDS
jgi:hypothetical protein